MKNCQLSRFLSLSLVVLIIVSYNASIMASTKVNHKYLNSDFHNLLIPINQHNKYYGCSQEWYTIQSRKDTGCGPATAANQLAYFQKFGNVQGTLYNQPTYSKNDFINFMNSMYTVCSTSGIYGTLPSSYRNGIISYASSRNVTLSPIDYTVNGVLGSINELARTIRDGLSVNRPVALAYCQLGPNQQPYGHWVLVTEYWEQNGQFMVKFADPAENRTYNPPTLSGGVVTSLQALRNQYNYLYAIFFLYPTSGNGGHPVQPQGDPTVN